eukprot:augustus_masked-scaffold_9-processed-gene-13.4-mRNA-1 protein AED:1.00 eAED:1.00 QI:0/0/0/0/1/1/2/0/931
MSQISDANHEQITEQKDKEPDSKAFQTDPVQSEASETPTSSRARGRKSPGKKGKKGPRSPVARGIQTRGTSKDSLLTAQALDELKKKRREDSRMSTWNARLEALDSLAKQFENQKETLEILQRTTVETQELQQELAKKIMDFLANNAKASTNPNQQQQEDKPERNSDLRDDKETIDSEKEQQERDKPRGQDKYTGDEAGSHISAVESQFSNKTRTSVIRGFSAWSETASTYVDKEQKKKSLQRTVPPRAPDEFHNGGIPSVHFDPPAKLTELKYESISNFVHEFKNVKVNVPGVSACGLLSKNVADTLYLRGVQTNSSNAILRYLQRHLAAFERMQKKRAVKNLKQKLAWESKYLNEIEQIYFFFDQVASHLRFLNQEEVNKNQKKILKLVVNKIPDIFDVDIDELAITMDGLNLNKLKTYLLSRSFVINKKEESMHNKKNKLKGIRPVQDMKGLRPKDNIPPPKFVSRIKLRRLGNEARTIGIMLKEKSSGESIKVKGLADTGADRNVSSVQAMEPYKVEVEDPIFIKEIQLPDKSLRKVTKVISAHVKLTQAGDQVDIGVQCFFCIDNPAWDEEIGKELKEALGPVIRNAKALPEHKILVFDEISKAEMDREKLGLFTSGCTLILVNAIRSNWQGVFSLFGSLNLEYIESIIFLGGEQRKVKSHTFHISHTSSRYLIFWNGKFDKKVIRNQTTSDVIQEFIELSEEMQKIFITLLDVSEVAIEFTSRLAESTGNYPEADRTVILTSKLKVLPIEEVTSTHFQDLENINDPAKVTPIVISNLVDDIPEELNEIGIGEGNIEQVEEKKLIKKMIVDKLEESTLSALEKEQMIETMKSSIESWGLKQSNAQMSLLDPIHVDLVKDHKILRSDGYHQSPEAEEFLELKFRSLQEAEIVEPAKNPLWGHPVFVVPKKMSVPSNWSQMDAMERAD